VCIPCELRGGGIKRYQFQAKPKSHGWGTDYRTYNLKLVLSKQKLNPTLEVLSCQFQVFSKIKTQLSPPDIRVPYLELNT
jgi:hypothetical protein